MNSLSKCFIILFGFVGGILLFLALLRLSNGKSAFIGVSDLYYYFQDVDIIKPFRKFIDYLNDIKNDFFIDFQNIESWNFQINSISDFFTSLGNFFSYIGTLLFDLLKFLAFPFYLSYYIIEFIITLFGTFFTFISSAIA